MSIIYFWGNVRRTSYKSPLRRFTNSSARMHIIFSIREVSFANKYIDALIAPRSSKWCCRMTAPASSNNCTEPICYKLIAISRIVCQFKFLISSRDIAPPPPSSSKSSNPLCQHAARWSGVSLWGLRSERVVKSICKFFFVSISNFCHKVRQNLA